MWTLVNDAAKWLIRRAEQSYAAPTIEDAREICRVLQARGFGSSVCFWNSSLDSVEEITRACLSLLELLQDTDSHCYLSVKAPAMGFDTAAITNIVQAAARMPRLIHFDSHGLEDAVPTFEVIERALKYNRNLGCTIPGRWLRSPGDANAAVGWGLRVRVVKGQWPDPQQPEMDLRAGFLKVIDALQGRAVCVAVASHDIPLARESLRRLLYAGTPCELELLYGLPHGAAVHMAQRLGVPVRFYIPQGKAWLPYLLNHARKNPRVLGWFARDVVRGLARRPAGLRPQE